MYIQIYITGFSVYFFFFLDIEWVSFSAVMDMDYTLTEDEPGAACIIEVRYIPVILGEKGG